MPIPIRFSNSLGPGLLALSLLVVGASSVHADPINVFHDRPSFLTAAAGMGVPLAGDDYEAYALGPIPNGGVRGDFAYEFDPTLVQPAVVPSGFGGQALGGGRGGPNAPGEMVPPTFGPECI